MKKKIPKDYIQHDSHFMKFKICSDRHNKLMGDKGKIRRQRKNRQLRIVAAMNKGDRKALGRKDK